MNELRNRFFGKLNHNHIMLWFIPYLAGLGVGQYDDLKYKLYAVLGAVGWIYIMQTFFKPVSQKKVDPDRN